MSKYSEVAAHTAKVAPAAAYCNGKERFESQALAAKVAGRSTRRHSGALHAYRCPACAGWHCGTPSKRDRRAPKTRGGEE